MLCHWLILRVAFICSKLCGKITFGISIIQDDSTLLSVFLWPIIFEQEKKKSKLLMEYESVTEEVLLHRGSVLQNPKQLQHARLSLYVKYLSGIQFPSKCSPAFAV
jgi:hypothetical protein